MNWESLSEEKRGLEGAMITLYKYLEGHNKEDRDQLLSLVRTEQEVMPYSAGGKPRL